MISVADLDGDGKLDFEEFKKVIRNGPDKKVASGLSGAGTAGMGAIKGGAGAIGGGLNKVGSGMKSATEMVPGGKMVTGAVGSAADKANAAAAAAAEKTKAAANSATSAVGVGKK